VLFWPPVIQALTILSMPHRFAFATTRRASSAACVLARAQNAAASSAKKPLLI
jgi:hypothetical protein